MAPEGKGMPLRATVVVGRFTLDVCVHADRYWAFWWLDGQALRFARWGEA